MEQSINKKEYLKKYMSGTDKKKRKKRIAHSSHVKSKIIDDDIDLSKMKAVDDNELEIYDLTEDAPQIAGIIDERPEEVIASEYTETKKWKIVTREYEDVQVTSLKENKDNAPKLLKNKPHLSKVDSRKKAVSDDSDASPPRAGRDVGKNSDIDSDASPPRKNRKEISPSRNRGAKSSDVDSDASPPRKGRKDVSPNRNRGTTKKPTSPNSSDSDASPPRKTRKKNSDSDASPPRKERSHGAKSDGRNGERAQSRQHKHHSESRHKSHTLEGKRAGLQSAEELKKEVAEIRKREQDNLQSLNNSMSGRNAATIVRDKKTGRKRDPKEESRLQRQKDEKNAEKVAQYSVWGKGVKQVEDRTVKLKEDLYEMSKPVARYVDDEDLEEMRKNEEYDDDPMIDYIRSKRRKEGKPEKTVPQYQGSYMPNRFNIRPGHKWDGVDRSNGYEKKWFEERNSRKATEEQAHKWSTEDM